MKNALFEQKKIKLSH